jgi:CYTH domain
MTTVPQNTGGTPKETKKPPRLPDGTEVTGQEIPGNAGVIESAAWNEKAKRWDYVVVATKDKSKRTLPSWKTLAVHAVPVASAVDDAIPVVAQREHKITTDAEVEEIHWTSVKTPGGLLRIVEKDLKDTFGSAGLAITEPVYSTDDKVEGFARIITDVAAVTDTSLTVHVTLLSNPEYMAKPHDLVPVWLVRPDDHKIHHIQVTQPGAPGKGNKVDFDVTYTWEQLLNLKGGAKEFDSSRESLRDYVVRTHPQVHFIAEWLAGGDGATNGPNHFSGGATAKGGSGTVKLRPLTEQELKESESRRVSDWNLSERLRPDDRPVYAKYHAILQPGLEMATSLEAESEYVVSGTQFAAAVDMLAKLKPHQALKDFGIRSMKPHGTKETTDTYYDLADHSLLRNRIVLRRRHVSTDKDGVFLFSMKGRSSEYQGEVFRLAAQVHLQADPTSAEVGAFCFDDMTDNAFARMMVDALGGKPNEADRRLHVALTVKSTRTKYSLQLDNGTTIEFSADAAHVPDTKGLLHCVELGVGHPALIVSDAAPARQAGMQQLAKFVRPYHVPDDLEPKTLVQKADFQQFKTLRDLLIPALLGARIPDLTRGGNKAHDLAKMINLI